MLLISRAFFCVGCIGLNIHAFFLLPAHVCCLTSGLPDQVQQAFLPVIYEGFKFVAAQDVRVNQVRTKIGIEH